jgi:hypothetical protein
MGTGGRAVLLVAGNAWLTAQTIATRVTARYLTGASADTAGLIWVASRQTSVVAIRERSVTLFGAFAMSILVLRVAEVTLKPACRQSVACR